MGPDEILTPLATEKLESCKTMTHWGEGGGRRGRGNEGKRNGGDRGK